MNARSQLDLLIVDDDVEIRRRTCEFFARRGYGVAEAADGLAALELAQQRVFHVAVVDLSLPGFSGIELLTRLRDVNVETETVMLTGHGTIENAVESMKLGAYDFLTKPVRLGHLAAVVDRAAEAGRLRRENRHLRRVVQQTHTSSEMIGECPAMRDIFRLIHKVGQTDKPVLIQGESGTGKELVAKAIHQASPLAQKPLVVVNCAALPEALLESELFGHEKGAFTGATASKEGLFEVADEGTLFIDEIGELSPSLQPKLLRVLEDGWMRRVGSIKDRRVRVRIVAATNRDLAGEVAEKRFREDLYYRINVLTICVPPLRERGNDVSLLTQKLTGPGWEWEPEAAAAVNAYHWPGNVRQLVNAVERAKILADNEMIRLKNLPPDVLAAPTGLRAVSDTRDGPDGGDGGQLDLATVTRARIAEALRQQRGNKLRAAKALGVSRRSLYRLLEKYHFTENELSAT